MKKQYTGREWSQNRFARFQIGIIIALLGSIYAFNYESSPLPFEIITIEAEQEELDQLVRVFVNTAPKTRAIQIKPEHHDSPPQQEVQVELVKAELVSSTIPITSDPSGEVSYTKELADKLPLPNEGVLDVAEIESDKVYSLVEKMPLHEECINEFVDYKDQLDCTNKKIIAAIQHHLKYPALPRENGIETTVVSSFLIDNSGKISEIKIEKERGYGFDEAVLKACEHLPSLNPGEQNKQKVHVKMYVPIKFKLSN